MSAFLCSSEHISALAAYAVRHRLWKNPLPDPLVGDAEVLGRALHRENLRSLRALYGDRKRPPFVFSSRYAEAASAGVLSPIEIIKAAHCFRYQECEHKGDATTRELRRVIEIIIEHAIHDVPGYEEAAWGIRESLSGAPAAGAERT
jgi:hypothetical protein